MHGHSDDSQGNLRQLMMMTEDIASPCVIDWIKEKKYLSPEIVNKQITMMGMMVLRTVLRNVSPRGYATVADEATDMSNRDQFNLSLRWVDD